MLFQNSFFDNETSQIRTNLEIYIVDNAGTINESDFSHSNLHLIKNRNLGGAGGFTRGMIESMESRSQFTHVLFMDDDALINPESIELVYSLLSFTKPEFKDVFIGGATLRLDQQSIQLESGAIWNNNLLFNLKAGIDLCDSQCILYNEVEESVSYNAWVFSCIPLCIVSENNFPLPLFMRGDDMEYGLRNSRKILTMNGICSWHIPIHNRYSASLNYYMLRNQLILNALYDPEYDARKAAKLLRDQIIHELLLFRYDNLLYIYKAYEDFLRGVDFFKETDGEKIHKDLQKISPRMISFSDLSRTAYPYIRAKHDFACMEQDRNFLSRFVRHISLNGYLLPPCFKRRGAWENYGIVELTSARPINFFRRKRVLQVDLISKKGYVTEIKRIELWKALLNYLRLSHKLKHGGYKKACSSYKENRTQISNIKFWKKYLKMGVNNEV